MVSAVTIAAEVGDLRRFATAQPIHVLRGPDPLGGQHGTTATSGAITRCGNGHLRRILVEAAWHYRHRPLMSEELRRRNQGVATGVQRIAWEAQKRLHKRMYHLIHAGKSANKAVTALARELAGFIWAVGQEETLLEASEEATGKHPCRSFARLVRATRGTRPLPLAPLPSSLCSVC